MSILQAFLMCTYLLFFGLLIGIYILSKHVWGKANWGILFRWQSWWVGAHWSDYNRRLCVNFVPFFTVWVTEANGKVPEQGFDIYRSDVADRGSWSP
jgi:hypothetical protein